MSMLRVLAFFIVFYGLQSVAVPLPASSFSQLPSAQNPQLSPSGNKMAFIANVSSPKASVSYLTTFNFDTGKRQLLLNSDNETVRIRWFRWANDDQIIVSAVYADKRPNGFSRTKVTETRLYVLDANTPKEPELLIKPRRHQYYSQYQDNVIDFLPDDPEHILLAIDLDQALLPSVFKVNINTKKKKRIEKGKRKIRDWVTDQQGNLRIGISMSYKNGETKILHAEPNSKDFEPLFSYNTMTEPEIAILGFGLDPYTLYYKKYHNGFLALFRMDLKNKSESLVLADDERDVDGRLIYSRKSGDAIGVGHSNAKGGKYFWDEEAKSFATAISNALPDTRAVIVSFDKKENRYLLYTEKEDQPGEYFLGDRTTKQLGFMFGQYPALDDVVLPEHKRVTYKARDGITIEGYLTLPDNPNNAPLPTVIFPHGGPGARDYDGFDYWTGFFVNQGYAVLRPNFRGSSGYGYEFAQAQMKAWGLSMQDDITDGTQWLIDESIADPDKICIVGASYGGYAAAMGLVKTPSLFKCGISIAGVMNLKMLVYESRKYVGSNFVENQIGDDNDDLASRSPYYGVEKITSPLLLIHGEEDRVVDVSHSRQMFDEMKDEDKQVEYIELENGSHFLKIQRNRHAVFAAMERFLALHLKQ